MRRNLGLVLLAQTPLAVMLVLWLRGGAAAPAAVRGSLSALAVVYVLAQAFLVRHLLGPRGTLFAPAMWRGAPQPRVALTFDDGPHPVDTPAILDILRATGARATFFFIGRNARRHPDLVRRVAAEGHEVAVHSDTHPWWFSVATPQRVRREGRGARVPGGTGRAPAGPLPPAGGAQEPLPARCAAGERAEPGDLVGARVRHARSRAGRHPAIDPAPREAGWHRSAARGGAPQTW